MNLRGLHAYRSLFAFGEEIADALHHNRPIVGLESATLARAFPIKMAIEVEQRVANAVRENGAIPALVYLRDQRIQVGGTPEDIEMLAGDRTINRVSRGTLIGALHNSGYAVTTVSASMMLCNMVGISILAVGGIGGVHAGAFCLTGGAESPSLDVSADLEELTRTPVTVVASGAKSFLDLPATMQWLETRGVPVITLGSRKIPGYFSVESSEDSPLVVEDVEEGARLLQLQAVLSPEGGALFCVPIPSEAAISSEEINRAVGIGKAEVAAKGVMGGAVTAAILDVIARETNNRTLEAQASMRVRNGAIAAALARRLSPQSRADTT